MACPVCHDACNEAVVQSTSSRFAAMCARDSLNSCSLLVPSNIEATGRLLTLRATQQGVLQYPHRSISAFGRVTHSQTALASRVFVAHVRTQSAYAAAQLLKIAIATDTTGSKDS